MSDLFRNLLLSLCDSNKPLFIVPHIILVVRLQVVELHPRTNGIQHALALYIKLALPCPAIALTSE